VCIFDQVVSLGPATCPLSAGVCRAGAAPSAIRPSARMAAIKSMENAGENIENFLWPQNSKYLESQIEGARHLLCRLCRIQIRLPPMGAAAN